MNSASKLYLASILIFTHVIKPIYIPDHAKLFIANLVTVYSIRTLAYNDFSLSNNRALVLCSLSLIYYLTLWGNSNEKIKVSTASMTGFLFGDMLPIFKYRMTSMPNNIPVLPIPVDQYNPHPRFPGVGHRLDGQPIN